MAQEREVKHPPQAGTGLPGLVRPLSLALAHYIIPLHPGWRVTETLDTIRGLTRLVCTLPPDSLDLQLQCISRPVNGAEMTSHEWDNLKDQLRSEYGDRKIGTMVLLDTTMIGHPTSEGIVGRLELLARMPDHLEFAAAVVTTREILLLTAPIPNEEITSKVPFYRSIVAEIRVQK